MTNIPDAVLTQHIAIVGKTGSGKTFTAKGLVETLLALGRRVCVIDPTGAWWGLRSSADGTKPGFPVIILGGNHADVTLPAESGVVCAGLVADQSVQVVFDTSLMSVGDRTRWFAAFGMELFRRNTRPLHLVIDEAHMFAPQGKVPDPETGKMLHAANTLASGGRSRGVRLMMITQRPAKLHKDSLTCCDTLIAMRVIAPQDREAIEDWVSGNGDTAKAKQILNSLAGLARGEGWVWYPEGGFLERMKFPGITTFDSSATPTDGHEVAVPKSLAEIDLSSITATMSAAVEEAHANDPKRLRAEIAELKKKLGDAGGTKAEDAGHRAEIAMLDERCNELLGQIERLRVERTEERFKGILEGRIAERDAILSSIESRKLDDPVANSNGFYTYGGGTSRNGMHHALEREAPRREAIREPDSAGRQTGSSAARAPAPRAPHHESAPARELARAGQNLKTPHQKLVNAVAWWAVVGINRPTRAQVAAIAGYTPTGGTWRNLMSECRTAGLIEYDGDAIYPTGDGWLVAELPDKPASLNALHRRVLDNLSVPQGKVLGSLFAHKTAAMPRDHIAALNGYEATGGTWRNLVSELKTLGMITYPNKKTMAAAAWLFPGGLT